MFDRSRMRSVAWLQGVLADGEDTEGSKVSICRDRKRKGNIKYDIRQRRRKTERN
jgi:hypothetical protein